MIKKKTTVKNLKSSPIKTAKISKKNQPSKAVVLQQIHLPTVVDAPKKRISWKRGFVISLLLAFDFCTWTYLSFQSVDFYNCHYAKRHNDVIAKPQHKKNVVATIGNYEISLDDVKAFVANVPQLSEVPFDQVYPNILDMMINDRVIANGAKRYGIPNDPKVQKMIQVATDQIIAQAYMAKEMERALTEDDIKAAYEDEVKNFKPKEEIHARHILVPTEKQAQDILIQLKAGADFGLLADQKSIDKNAPKGDLGYFTQDMMIPEFAEKVFVMKKGELSGPVHTAYGWHIILVEDRRETQPPAFDQVRDQMQRLAVEKKVPAILAAERVRQKVRVIRPTLTLQPKPEVKKDDK